MLELIKNINKFTYSEKIPKDDYSTQIQLFDPHKNIYYNASFPQVISQMTWLYQ